MTMRVLAGWDFAVLGNGAFAATDTGGTDTLTYSSGKYLHEDISTVLSAYSDFATQLQTDLNASGTLNGTYTVTWSSSAFTYTIACDESFTATLNTVMKNTLGFSADLTPGATSHVSDIRPYYLISTLNGCKSQVSDDYEPRDIVEGSYADDGTPYAVSRTSPPIFHDFSVRLETRAAVYSRAATVSVAWTWQHLFQHVRGTEPLLVVDGSESAVHTLRPESAYFQAQTIADDYTGHYDIRLETYLRGRL